MFRLGMFVACAGFVTLMIHTAYRYKLEEQLVADFGQAMHQPVLEMPEASETTTSPSAPSPTLDVISVEPAQPIVHKSRLAKVGRLSTEEIGALALAPGQIEKTAEAFKALGPDDQALEVVAFDAQWANYSRQNQQAVSLKQGHRALVFRIRPVGYTPAVELGGTKFAGRYTLIDQAGHVYVGSIVGFVGRTDVVRFEVPINREVAGGEIRVVQSGFKVSRSIRP